jgi:hypothetical protein
MGSGIQPSSYPVDARVLSLGVKWFGYEANHSPPFNAEAKNAWSYSSTFPYICMAWCLIKNQAQLYLFLTIINTNMMAKVIS